VNTFDRLRDLLADAATESGIALASHELDMLADRVTVNAAQGLKSVVRLSPRLFDALQGLAAGESIPDTAARLHVSENTVKTHRRLLYERLGAKSGAHAVAIADAQGLLLPIGAARPMTGGRS
jgi:DNA-binding NarL/FixJ family response regulator